MKIKAKIFIPFISLLIIIGALLLRIYRFYEIPILSENIWENQIRNVVLTRLDSIMFGVIGSFISIYYKNFWKRFTLAFFALGLLLLFSLKVYPIKYSGILATVFIFPLQSIATLFLLPYLSTIKKGHGIFQKTITGISIISYSLYLVHRSIVLLFLILVVLQGRIYSVIQLSDTTKIWISYLCYWLLSILAAIILYSFVEKPFMKMRNRL